MHRRPLAAACLAVVLAVAQALISALPVQAQGEASRAGNPSRPITDAFARDAVTYDDHVNRAAVQPYVSNERLVALSLDTPKHHVADPMA